MPIVAQLAITMDDAGQINVNGPIENRVLCYGLLEMAKDAIKAHAEQSKKLIAEVPPGTHLRPVK